MPGFPGTRLIIYPFLRGLVLVIVPGEHTHHPQISKPKAGLLTFHCASELLGDVVKMQIMMQ